MRLESFRHLRVSLVLAVVGELYLPATHPILNRRQNADVVGESILLAVLERVADALLGG
jgi:hypothetical protein